MGNCCISCLTVSALFKSPCHYGSVSKNNSSEPRLVNPTLKNEIGHPMREFVDVPLDD